MENENFYESAAAAELADAYEQQRENDDLDLILIFVLLFCADKV